jgi:uncharacterized protein with FMN-binding domain
VAVLALGALLVPWAVPARVLLDVEAALAEAFPGCQVERGTVYLDAAQLARAREAAGVEVSSGLVVPYGASCGGVPAGTAYFDAHRVRTLQETVMVVVDVAGRVERVEVLSFDEPPDYLPGAAWYRQFVGRVLDADLALARDIDGVTGATLTARATTEAVRRVLAVHGVLAASQGASP